MGHCQKRIESLLGLVLLAMRAAAALGRYFLGATLARHSRLNVSSRASLALNPRFALYLSAQLKQASWCAFCETWFSAIGRQTLADRSVWCHSTARRQPACQCSLPASHVCSSLYCVDSRSPLPSSAIDLTWRLLQPHAITTRYHSREQADRHPCSNRGSASLHIPEQLLNCSLMFMQSFAPLTNHRSTCQGPKSPIAFPPPADRGQWRSSKNFLCRFLAHRKPAAVLAEVTARLRNPLISIQVMAGGLVIRHPPRSQCQAWMWSSLPATGLQSALLMA